MPGFRFPHWPSLVAGILAGGLGVGGAFYAASGAASGSSVVAAPAAARRVMGEVTAITADPAAFTVRTQQGDETTYRVLETTVFKAGYDRPYNFGLLKPGDGVIVAVPMDRPAQADAGPPAPAKPGGAAAERARPPRRAAEIDALEVPRLVVVRPAGDGPYRGGGVAKPGAANPAAKPGVAKKGANDGAGQ